VQNKYQKTYKKIKQSLKPAPYIPTKPHHLFIKQKTVHRQNGSPTFNSTPSFQQHYRFTANARNTQTKKII